MPCDGADAALKELQDGNRRFAEGRACAPRRDLGRLRAVSGGQSPRAAVLTCSDSRVPPEILFDQGLGDLFVVRSAGHVVDRGILGSLEYAVEHLRPSILVVLGHSGCGAVTGAVAGGGSQGAVGWVVAEIQPAIHATRLCVGDPVDNAARAHAKRTAERLLCDSSVLREATERGDLRVITAYYDIGSGLVDLL